MAVAARWRRRRPRNDARLRRRSRESGNLCIVIASEAKQSRVSPWILDCFVASLLAMTRLLPTELRALLFPVWIFIGRDSSILFVDLAPIGICRFSQVNAIRNLSEPLESTEERMAFAFCLVRRCRRISRFAVRCSGLRMALGLLIISAVGRISVSVIRLIFAREVAGYASLTLPTLLRSSTKSGGTP